MSEELRSINREMNSQIPEVHADLQNLSTVASIIHMIPDPVLVLNTDLYIEAANDIFYKTFEMQSREITGRLIYEMNNGQWDIPELHALLEEILSKQDVFTGYEVDLTFGGTDWRTMLLNGRRLNQVGLILLTIIDITAHNHVAEALRESEERFRGILEQDIVGVVFAKLDGTIVSVNKRHTKITGYSEHELLRLNILDVTHPDDRAHSQKLYAQLAQGGEPFTLEKRYIRKDGKVVWVEKTAATIRDARGNPLSVVAFTVDVTGRKRAEDALRVNARRQAFLVQLADALRPLADPVEIQIEAARLLGTHLEASRVFYAELEEDDLHCVISRDYYDGLPSVAGRYRLDSFGSTVLNTLRIGQTLRISDVMNEIELEEDVQAAFAAIEVCAAVGLPLIKNNRLVAFLGLHQVKPRAWTDEEITLIEETAERTWAAVERARAEAALRASEERYRTLFNSIDEGFCVFEMIFDADGKPVDYRWLETNPAFEEQTGLVDAVGKRARELVPNLEEHWFEIYGKVALTGEPVRFTDQSEAMGRWFDVYGFRLGEPDSHKVALLFTDVTARVKSDEAVRQMNAHLEERVDQRTAQVRRLVSQLTMSEQAERRRISQILHDDLQQQLYGVQFQLAILRSSLENKDQARTLGLINEIEEILNNSVRISRDLSVDLNPPILYGEGLAEAVSWLASQMKEQHGLSVEVRAEDDLLVFQEDLRVLLFQIVRELLFNVVKHADVSTAQVSLARTNSYLQIEVTDQGRGLNVEAIVNDAKRSNGLWKSRRRLELVGGRMEIESRPGGGTRIILHSPIDNVLT